MPSALWLSWKIWDSSHWRWYSGTGTWRLRRFKASNISEDINDDKEELNDEEEMQEISPSPPMFVEILYAKAAAMRLFISMGTFANIIWLALQIRGWIQKASKKPINEADDGNWFFSKDKLWRGKERKKIQ